MKTRLGKITLITLTLLLATAAIMVGYMATKAWAAGITYTNTQMIRSTVTYPEVVFVEWPSGNVVDAVTGTPALAETFEANEMPDMAQHAESDFWTFTTPPLNGNKKWVMVICDAVAADGAVETDLAKDTTLCFFYNPKTNALTEADLGSAGDGIYTRPMPME